MKKKYISLVTSALSAVAAVFLLTCTVICIFQIKTVVKTIQDVTDDLSGIKLIKYAGIAYLFAVLGICLTLMLAFYRASLAYYYFKIYRGDEAFYRERKNGIIGFSVLAVVAAAACIALGNIKSEDLPRDLPILLRVFAVFYIVLAILPIGELVYTAIAGTLSGKTVLSAAVPAKEEIAASLEAEADAATPKKDEAPSGKTDRNDIAVPPESESENAVQKTEDTDTRA